ncbi:Ig-like domain-containing protein [Marinobacter zhejiangensis]|uniref:Intein C-terminal splicing region/intein N-terminal splicing region/RHS repeat-associated core domain-containing protein n=1 Tax=Marinobacter zhejiangensis TaxID=488535 RepID=A0A1I4LJL8_9GAMM|nr:tandem-95 repeat protein [Marinobacter zhejiangensis]SFL91172.1 intein C-terminal splicing region/intein N-terminal splicing region/RHS repeat-associated core domain-containing protein [Marinobacter zhejiangensis]
MKFALGLAFAWFVVSAGSVSAGTFRETEDIVISPDFCSLYPLTVSSSLLDSAIPGQTFQNIPLGTGPGQYNWLTWQGDNDAPLLAAALVPPGTSRTYINPGRASDHQLNIGDLVEGAPGVMNSRGIRSNLDALLGDNIIIPVWGEYSGQGANLDYGVAQFAVVRLTDYKLSGQGYISFTFERFTRCYNVRPEALDSQVTTPEDTPLDFLLQAQDADGDELNFEVLSAPQHGVIEHNNGQVIYSPHANYYGPDSLTFQVHDDEQLSGMATVTIDVTPVNDAPVATPAHASGPEDTLIPLQFSGSDIEESPLTFTVVVAPTHGSVVETATGYAYLPDENYFGPDQLTYVANDGELDSAPAVHGLTIIPVNDPPVAEDVYAETEGGDPVAIMLVGSDIDSDELVYSLLDSPSHGTMTGDAPDLFYTPAPDFEGVETLTYQVSDGELSATATITINVIQPNLPPVITSPPMVTTPEQSPYQYPVLAEDPNKNDVLTYSLLRGPAEMGIGAESGVIQWLPSPEFTQTVPTFNDQCYVVPTGSVKEYEEGDDAAGVAYIAPLFFRVREAIADASDYVAPQSVAWHRQHQCLGCHVQTQSVLGLQASREKADVDETAAEYLLSEILASQLSDGSIRRSHPGYAKNQTAFALWALNAVPDRARTLSVRQQGLKFFTNRVSLSGQRAYWTNDHASGWLRNPVAITALVSQASSDLLQDFEELDVLTAEQQELADFYRQLAPNLADYLLAGVEANESDNLKQVFRLIGLAELVTMITDESLLARIDEAVELIDGRLRDRQLEVGGWAPNVSGTQGDPLTSAWVGLALDYGNPAITDPVVLANIEYLLDTQQANGTWNTNSGLFSTKLATTSLVMAYLPVALDHLGNPDVRLGHVRLVQGSGEQHELSVQLGNRGLADISVPLAMDFYAGTSEEGVLLGTAQVDELDSGGTAYPAITVFDNQLTDDLTVVLRPGVDIEECQITNNATRAALVRVEVADPDGLTDDQLFALNVEDVNEAPVINSEPAAVLEGGQSFEYQIEVTDGDVGDAHRYSLLSGPEGLYLDERTGRFTSVPGGIAPGEYSITVLVTDLRGATTQQTFTLVIHENLPPQIVTPAVVAGGEDSGYRYDVDATDPNVGDELSYGLEFAPEGMAIVADTGLIEWSAGGDWVDNRTDSHGLCIAEPEEELGTLSPVEKWRWDVAGQPAANYNQVMHAPIAVPLYDTNGDGRVDVNDDIAIIFQTFRGGYYYGQGYLRAVWAKNGQPVWTSAGASILPEGSPAAADIDGDGFVEIVTPRYGGGIIAFSHDGQVEWESSSRITIRWGGASFADLNGDGITEIVVGNAVFDNTGQLIWQGSGPSGNNGAGPLSFAADINGDGYQEVIAGGAAYSYDGQLLFNHGEGFAAVGDLDGDAMPEIVVVSSGQVKLLNHDGSLVWSGKSIPGGGNGGAPTIADMTGDGVPDIGVAGANRYVVFNADGAIVWQSPTRDNSSHKTGSSVFDFNGDGRAEVVYADEYYLRIYDGPTGQVIYEIANTSGTTYELPVVADVDNDNHAEIVVISNSYGRGNYAGVRVFEDEADAWAPTRSIWNQHAYSINNINDDLTIPARPMPSWLSHNTFRLNTFPDRDALSLADISVSGITYDQATSTASVTVYNRGLAPVVGPLTVSFVHDHFWTGEEALGQVTVDGLLPGETTQASLAVDDSKIIQALMVTVSGPADLVECDTDNNHTRAAIVDVRVFDEAGLFDAQKYAVSIADANDAPVFASPASSTAVVGERFSFQLEVSDPDRGDAHRFELVDGLAGFELNERTGELQAEGLAEGFYTLNLRATDLSGAVAEQTHVVTVTASDNLPPEFTSEAQGVIQPGETFSYIAQATDPDGDEVVYLLSRSQPGMTIDGVTGQIRWTPDAGMTGVFSAEVTALDTRGASSRQYFLIEVVDPSAGNQPPTITSSPNGAVYAGQRFDYQVTANDPDGDSLTFSLTQSEDGMTLSGSGLFSWLAPADRIGDTAIVEIQVDDGRGGQARQKLTLPVNESANHPPLVTSTPGTQALAETLYRYPLTATDSDGDSYRFSLDLAPNGMTLDGSLVSWTPSAAQAGRVHDVVVRVTDARGAASTQSYGIGVNAPVEANETPQISSLPTSPAMVGHTYGYDVVARDADGDQLSYALETGPAGMTLSGDGALRWTPVSDQVGAHNVRIRVSDGKSYVTQGFILDAVDDSNNSYPEITSRPTFQAVVGETYQYQLVATDADGDALTYGAMTQPAGLSVDSAGLVTWTPATEQLGLHDVVYFADDGKGRTLQSTSIRVQEEPLPLEITVLVSPDSVSAGDTVTIDVFAEGGRGEFDIRVDVDGEQLAVSPYGRTYWTAVGSGRHTVTAIVSDGSTTVTEQAYVTIQDDGDTVAPVVTLEGPATGSIVTAPTDIIATIQDDNLVAYEVLIAPSGDDNWQVIAEGGTSQVSAPVAVFDPSLLMNGQWDVAVIALDVNGQSASDMLSLQVEGDLKVGNFSITLEDLAIPMAGLPIRVTRTYDSRRRFEDLDFGHGWSVGYQDVKIEESRPLGSYWAINQYKRGPLNMITDFCIEPLGAPVVTVTLPTGDVERFEVGVSPRCNTYQVIKDVALEFTPVGTTQSELVALNDSTARYEGGTLLETGYYSGPVDPSRYQLTTEAGYVYNLNQDFGIDTVVDPNGHTLRYTNDGIFHSSGKAVTFNRDSDGRIRSITTPNGDVLNYSYTANGDLVASADAMANTTEYTYNRSHGLLEVIDPLGRRLVRNIYDDDGRLVAQEDNEGNITEFNHDLEGRQSVVTDRRGNTTLYYYDDRGNITTRVDAAGKTWQYTYDERGNQLSQLDPLGHSASATFDERNNQLTQTDGLGHTVAYTYNSRGQELTITDARGNLYRNTYDSVGNLLSVTDPEGNVAGNNINADGQVSKSVDAEGNATTYTYDGDGNKLSETNPLGATTRFTYDANGNVLSETRERTVNGSTVAETTRYVYDANNRVIETHHPDGTTVHAEYDVAGNQTAMVDVLGRRTEYAYDAFGRVTETYYPDGSVATRIYDAEGNVDAENDRLGRTTRYTYDALNRVIRSDYADGSHAATSYDAAGRVISESDGNGSVTHYEYDAAGRRTAVVDALGNRHSFSYDPDGNLTSETDANGHTTRYTYNALDQRTATVYHDGSKVTDAYDAMGRRTSHTDQNGRITTYEYDTLGRLIKVIDALEGATSFSYDAVGNKLTQADAEGRTTRWTYDSQGRVLSRTLPMGQTESFSYDAAGNRLSHTDFNGQTTSYQYDLNDHLTRVTYGDGTVETFSYDAVGNRLTATTPDGTTRYRYDAMNRLLEEIQPDGSVLSYGYDQAGNRVQLDVSTDDQTRSTSYSFDKLNRLATVNGGLGETVYSYDKVGNRASVSYPNGNVTSYSYDALNRLVALTSIDVSNAVVADYRYELDPTGRRTGVQELHNGRSTGYSYDELYRLIGETVTDPVNGSYSAEYQYDKVGNRTYSIVDGVHTAYSYDANDRLTQQGGVSYSYDANGNTLTETEDGQVTRYTYDARNMLVETTRPGYNASYGYNADGIRTRRTENGASTQFVVDSNRDYAQVLAEVSNGTTEVSYTYGDDLLVQQRSGATSYYLYDGHGSTRALADEGSTVTDTYHYDAFGVLLARAGDTENDYLYTGEQRDAGLEQYYLRARYYDQGVGRFTQMDTWMGVNHDPVTLHKYLYANADPVTHIDPTGNFSLGSVMSGINVMGNLAMRAYNAYSLFDSVFRIASGEESFDAVSMGTSIILSRLPTKLSSKLITRICGKNSFDGDTLVATESGLIPISDIKVGDLVWSYNEETGLRSLQEVVHLIVGEGEKEIVDISLPNGEVIEATAGHPFFEPNLGEWISAGELTQTQSLLSRDGELLSIFGLTSRTQNTVVYNLTVANDHNYYVGRSGVLSHNSSCRMKEVRVQMHSYEAARNRALQLLGPIDPASRRNIVGRLSTSKGYGQVVGFETKADGVWKQYRIDYDPEKGLHINVKVGKGNDMVVNHAIEFPGTERDFERLLRSFN